MLAPGSMPAALEDKTPSPGLGGMMTISRIGGITGTDIAYSEQHQGGAEAALHGNLTAAVRSRRLERICLDTCEAGKAAAEAEAGWLGGFL